MQILADNGGYVVADDGGRLVFFRRSIVPSWVPYVLGLVAVIAGANAVVLAVVASPVAALGGLLPVAVAAGFGCRWALARRRQARLVPLTGRDAVLQLDLPNGLLLGADGQALAPLGQVRVERTMQATSSARALTVRWPGGKQVVYRGDAMARHGSIDVAVHALAGRGVPIT